MNRALAVVLALAATGATWASSDGCAEPDADQIDFFSANDPGCPQHLPFLDVDNSALANAAVLLSAYDLEPNESELDAQPSWDDFKKYARDFFARHQGTAADDMLARWQSSYARWDLPCRTNSVAALRAFMGAIDKAVGVSPADAVALASMRLEAFKACGGTEAEAKRATLEKYRPKSGVARELGDYVLAAASLYSNDLEGAQKQFAALTVAHDPWVRENAVYQAARCLLIKSMNHDLTDQARKDIATEVESKSQSYLKQYPAGLYTESALGMLRRAYFDENREKDYMRLLSEAMVRANRRKDRVESLRLSEELVRGPAHWGAAYLDVRNPLAVPFVAMHALHEQKEAAAGTEKVSDSVLGALNSAQSDYAAYPGLFELARTSLELASGRNDLAASDAPADTQLSTAISVSQRLLNAWALERQKNWLEARRVWHEMLAAPLVKKDKILHHRFEAGLARSYLRADDFDGLFKISGPELLPYLSERILYQLGNPAKWDQIAFGKGWKPAAAIAAQKMLLNEALREERFADFSKIYARSSDASRKLFASANQGAEALVKHRDDPYGLLMVAGFIRRQELDTGYGYKLWSAYAGEFFREFISKVAPARPPGKTPLAMYQTATQACEQQSCSSFEAELLYRAITCFHGSGEGCIPVSAWEARQGVPQEKRQAWYTKLKKKYPDSSWAKKLKFYW